MNIRSLKRHDGSFLVIAIVVILVMSLVALALYQISVSNARATVAEVYGARAYQAAQSGLQVFLTELYPLDEEGAVPAACNAQNYTFTTSGLENCEAIVTCSDDTFDDYFVNRYSIVSQGVCEIGTDVYSRELAVEAYDVGA
ncbi:MAG: MSH system minor pilin protein MshP [Idiomarinaceae bacterium HL-53]|nr:MAG: MSH system minor pilin protein MshP [Idiomarinaceae bacterium HL-53]CUS47449.1 MSHA biogenesis protein MshP [Idiomarinaceae bacterium HL-53]